MSEPIKATRVGLGQLSKRKYVGRYYTADSSYSTMGQGHTTLQCKFIRASVTYERVAVFEDHEGTMFYHQNGEKRERTIQAELCQHCPEYLSNDWKEEGKCFGVMDERSMSFTPAEYNGFIEDYCSTCPVTAECFEYAANYEMSGTWGGIHIPQDYSRRKKVIEDHRPGEPE
jgi:hypothetical protein